MNKLELETPVLLVDQEKMLANISDMQGVAERASVSLRPHAKTHKCPEVAKLQLSKGAAGICVQKLGEAEVMVESGIGDIFITNEIVDPTKIERLVKLADKAKVRVAVDSLENAQEIGKAASAASKTMPVLIEVDAGMRRCGVPLGPPAMRLADKIMRIRGLHLQGVMAYEGHLYHMENKRRRQLVARRLIRKVVETVTRIRKLGADIEVVSCGSTPTVIAVANVPGVTEIQPGNYVFYDQMQVELGSAKAENCALHVLTTVISKSKSNRVVVDAGIKAFSYDSSQFPSPVGLPGAKPVDIYEEHLSLQVKGQTGLFNLGHKIEFIPYHACTAVNMYDRIHIVKNSEVIAIWPISARGKIV